MKKKFVIFGGIAIVMTLLVGIAIVNKPETVETIGGDKSGKRVQVEYIKQDDIESKISSSGKLEAIETQTIYLDATNKIVTLHKEVGDSVEAGEVIITLDEEAETSNQKQLESLETKLAASKDVLNDLLGSASQGEVLSVESNIASLKDSKAQIEKGIEDTKVNVENLNKQLSDSEKDLEVTEALFKEGLASEKEVDQLKDSLTTTKQKIDELNNSITLSEGNLKTLELQLQAAQYNLDVLLNKVEDTNKKQAITAKKTEIKDLEIQIYNAQNSLSKTGTEIIAPIDGVITYLPNEEGMTIAAGSQLVTIVDPSSLKVTCDISPYYAADLRIGLTAEVKYTGSKAVEVEGEVTKIAAVAEVKQTSSGETTSLPVEIKVNQPGDIIKPGFSVNVKVITDTRKNVCLVPILAVEEDDEDKSYVYIVGKEGTLEKREIEQGLSNGLYIEATNVTEGEMIVSSLEDFLKDGMKVSYEKIGDAQ